MCPHLSLLFVLSFIFQDVSTYFYINLLFYHPHHQSYSVIFLSQECPHLSLLFVSFFFLKMSPLSSIQIFCFIYIIQSFFFIPKMCPHLESFVCVIFFLLRCLHLSLCKPFVFFILIIYDIL